MKPLSSRIGKTCPSHPKIFILAIFADFFIKMDFNGQKWIPYAQKHIYRYSYWYFCTNIQKSQFWPKFGLYVASRSQKWPKLAKVASFWHWPRRSCWFRLTYQFSHLWVYSLPIYHSLSKKITKVTKMALFGWLGHVLPILELRHFILSTAPSFICKL